LGFAVTAPGIASKSQWKEVRLRQEVLNTVLSELLAERGIEATRASFRSGEIHVFDLTGDLERIISFNEADRRL
jgi:hypothetical protein